jgi:hypothetical protein
LCKVATDLAACKSLVMAEEAQQSVPTDGRSRGIVKWFDAVKGTMLNNNS